MCWLLMLLIGGAGGGVGYLQSHVEDFNKRFFLLEIATGAFVAWAVGTFLWGKGVHPYIIFPLIGICAVYSKEILRILRKKALSYLGR
jgi:hypothetical protein